MLRVRHPSKVFDPVVVPYVIDVMYLLIAREVTPNQLLDNDTVLEHPTGLGRPRMAGLVNSYVAHVVDHCRFPVVSSIQGPDVLTFDPACPRAILTIRFGQVSQILATAGPAVDWPLCDLAESYTTLGTVLSSFSPDWVENLAALLAGFLGPLTRFGPHNHSMFRATEEST